MSVRTDVLMGTTVTIDAADADAIDRAFAWFELVEQVCSRFDPASELSQVTTRVGEPVAVSRLLFETVQFAWHVADASGGAFDPTVGAEMIRRGFNREHRTGTAGPLAADGAAQATYRDVELDPVAHTVRLRRPLHLDLGAVAKGLAIDLAARELDACRDFAVDAGGDLYLGGRNANGEPWRIGIRHPRRAGEYIASVRVSDQAVCTSGDYERGGEGTNAPHLVDPRSGNSPSAVASVTVIAASAMLADALATAAFVLGPPEGRGLLERMEVEGLIVTGKLETIATAGWPGETGWSSE